MADSDAPAARDTPPPRAAERIRATARDLFYREGVRAVGVDTIVARAGVTKPTLYRCFSSKDELAATYLRDYDAEFWTRFEAAGVDCPDDPRRHILTYLTGLGERAGRSDYRGCGMSNVAVEYPEPDHPARQVAEASKDLLRERLTDMAARMGARNPALLGDGLLLLIEGAFISGQIFHAHGPACSIAAIAEMLIDASLKA
ncbi:TetR/AcrR family transcriptional regulator [Labrys monachus]|uniref:AcrR family transcriptional regulator n=1 Tax=Labrys monachus TaxID=217067 RepID=A0ABU0FK40_9HYPH|nr:TetR/AcrR family transcriptional regulator [Labrys monachus]MDQ0394712.1 AcrR family transcriptional regulator [Labrys monachus]